MRQEFCNLGTLLLRKTVIRNNVIRNFVIRNFDIRNLVPVPFSWGKAMVQSSVACTCWLDGQSNMMGVLSLLRSTAYRAAVFWLTTENTKPLPIPMLMSWPPWGVSTTTRWSPPQRSRLHWLPWAYSLFSSARRLSLSSSRCAADSGRVALLTSLLEACSTPLVADLPRSPRVLSSGAAVGSAVLILRRPLSPAESMNLSPAWQCRVRASRSLMVSLPSATFIAPGLTTPPPCSRRCSPGFGSQSGLPEHQDLFPGLPAGLQAVSPDPELCRPPPPSVRPAGLCPSPAGRTSWPSESRAESRGAVCCILPQSSWIPCPRPYILRLSNAASTANTAASREPDPASLSVSCPGMLGSRLGRSSSCIQTLDTASFPAPTQLPVMPDCRAAVTCDWRTVPGPPGRSGSAPSRSVLLLSSLSCNRCLGGWARARQLRNRCPR
jgi:hypothetical protein